MTTPTTRSRGAAGRARTSTEAANVVSGKRVAERAERHQLVAAGNLPGLQRLAERVDERLLAGREAAEVDSLGERVGGAPAGHRNPIAGDDHAGAPPAHLAV